MDNKKFEKLIDLIIYENEEQARELFHDIVVEKSREIYESIMDEEMMEGFGEEDEGMGGQVGDLMDEINSEEAGGMTEDDEDLGDLDDGEEEVIDIDADDMGDDMDAEGGEVEDAVVRIEDKLDQLMAEFEEIMGGGAEEDFGGEEGEEDFGGEEDLAEEADDEEDVMEAIALKKVSVTHGDNGAQTKSTVKANTGQAGMASKPVRIGGEAEAVPSSPKAPSNIYSKGETQVKGAGNFKNSPGKDNFKDKGESAPTPKKGDNGSNAKSPVAESKRFAKKPVAKTVTKKIVK